MKLREDVIPIIDLFAGPGGLGKGFNSFRAGTHMPFRIGLSVEKDTAAHSTLRLLAFFRRFARKNVPEDYYLHLRGEITRDELFERHRGQAEAASNEAWLATLGEVPVEELDSRVGDAIGGSKTWVLIGGPPCQPAAKQTVSAMSFSEINHPL